MFPTSERESPKMNCTTLQSYPSMATPKRVVTIIVHATVNFIIDTGFSSSPDFALQLLVEDSAWFKSRIESYNNMKVIDKLAIYVGKTHALREGV